MVIFFILQPDYAELRDLRKICGLFYLDISTYQPGEVYLEIGPRCSQYASDPQV